MTDNAHLIAAAEKNYDRFCVPTNFVDAVKRKRKYTPEQQADLDIKTSNNKIGEIVNLSQELNTLMWDALNGGASWEDAIQIFYDSSKLAVMSNIEIDSAKKEFTVSNVAELKKLGNKYGRKGEDGRAIKPGFFGHVAKAKGYYDAQKKNYKMQRTSMDYLQQIVNKECRNGRGKKHKAFIDIVDRGPMEYSRVRYDQIDLVFDAVRRMKADVQSEWSKFSGQTPERNGGSRYEEYQRIAATVENIRQDCVNYINSMKINYSTMYKLLMLIESNKTKDIKRPLFSILFGSPNESFFALIRQSATPIAVIRPSEVGEIDILGMKYHREMVHLQSPSCAA